MRKDSFSDIAFVSKPQQLVFSLQGSHATIKAGLGATKAHPGDCDRGWFSNDSTVILGGQDLSREERAVATQAEWAFEVDPTVIKHAVSGLLVIACERAQGGLHTKRKSAEARVDFNGESKDIIYLATQPQGHNDYFHFMMVPDQVRNIWPLSACNTVYSWPIHPNQLQKQEVQTLTLSIQDSVAWDIDYVVLILNVDGLDKELRPWIKTLLWALVAAFLGAVVSQLVG